MRLILNTPEVEPYYEVAVPRLVRQVASKCGLAVGSMDLADAPADLQTASDADQLADMILDTGRKLPIIVATLPEPGDYSYFNAVSLARASVGLSRVFIVSAPATWIITNRFDRARSVFGGAIRIYMPGFSEDANPYDHPLTIVDRLRTVEDARMWERRLQSFDAEYSLRHLVLGRQVLPFAAVGRAASQTEQRTLTRANAPIERQLEASNQWIKTLEAELVEQKNFTDQICDEIDATDEPARNAEMQARVSASRIRELYQEPE